MFSGLRRKFLVVCVAIIPQLPNAQIVASNGATISVLGGGVLHSNGGISLSNNSSLLNDGSIRITKNASGTLPGTLTIGNSCIVSGSGVYNVEQDWVNDGNFSADNSSVYLYGNTQQFITSTNNTETEFNQLYLTGNGTGNDRKKTLQNVNARISTAGKLHLNDRELSTLTNDMIVQNPSTNAVTNSLTFGSEGFVSSESPGNLIRFTNSANAYYFPVGSSSGVLRYRPVSITPTASGTNAFDVRLNNFIADNSGYFVSQLDDNLSDLNALFFHSIEHSTGTTNAAIEIAFDPVEDGEWNAIGQWNNGTKIWNSIAPNNPLSLGNYSSLDKENWNFPGISNEYILANLQLEMTIPNVFTPNNDGTNDTYFVTGEGFTDYSIVIVNRWGNIVYESDDITEEWDGTSHGTPCNSGVYFYVIRAKSGSKEIVRQGNISLLSN